MQINSSEIYSKIKKSGNGQNIRKVKDVQEQQTENEEENQTKASTISIQLDAINGNEFMKIFDTAAENNCFQGF